ncbi:iron-siderophore ABC transporter substrate-binding protein [Oceanitalea stevensii]|uniref:iron-siderophore ABC transporter substrate-binding protein n=1 Tax=Oceanitalea stevensii TaxID=2763072 RepID=UPI002044E301|nr:iron-siderophore ABC transporter substrate-binding protein [Oceanitalea stevensii]
MTATLLLSLTLAACGDDGGSQEPEDQAPATTDGAFPVVVETTFGDVTVEEEPERVVALGWGDAETALALGVQPVGASDWLGFGGEGVGPWAQGLYDEAPEIIETMEPSFEAIAALEPDLILDVKSSGDQARYDRLASIAPTIGVPEGGESYLTTTEQQLEMIAAALGQQEGGEQLLTDLEDTFAQARADHPDWEGLTATAATLTSEGWGAYVEGSERVDFLEKLGFVQNPQIAEMEPDASGFSVSLSAERLDALDADLVVAFPIFIETSEITEDPMFQQLPAVADGRALVIDGDLASAYSLGTVLSQQYAVEQIVPMLEEALS